MSAEVILRKREKKELQFSKERLENLSIRNFQQDQNLMLVPLDYSKQISFTAACKQVQNI